MAGVLLPLLPVVGLIILLVLKDKHPASAIAQSDGGIGRSKDPGKQRKLARATTGDIRPAAASPWRPDQGGASPN